MCSWILSARIFSPVMGEMRKLSAVGSCSNGLPTTTQTETTCNDRFTHYFSMCSTISPYSSIIIRCIFPVISVQMVRFLDVLKKQLFMHKNSHIQPVTMSTSSPLVSQGQNMDTLFLARSVWEVYVSFCWSCHECASTRQTMTLVLWCSDSSDLLVTGALHRSYF